LKFDLPLFNFILIQGLDFKVENWSATSESQNQVKCAFMLNVVVTESATVFKLHACVNHSLLVRRDAFLILDPTLQFLYGVTRVDLDFNSLASQRLDIDQHPLALAVEVDFNELSLLRVVLHDPLVGYHGSVRAQDLAYDRKLCDPCPAIFLALISELTKLLAIDLL